MTDFPYTPLERNDTQQDIRVNKVNAENGTGSPPVYVHKSKPSNPFEVLYDPQKAHSPTGYDTPLIQSYKYLEMNHGEINGVSNSKSVRQIQRAGATNIVTVIGSTDNVHRTGSMVSRSATLKNRNKIKKRNKMVRKNDLEEDKHSSKDKKRSKLAFMFPVNRSKSLKKNARYTRLNRSPKFANMEEFQQFFDNINAGGSVPEMVPPAMNYFKYKRLFLPDPKLVAKQKYFQITKSNSFVLSQKPKMSKLAISLPIKETFTKNGVPGLDQNFHMENNHDDSFHNIDFFQEAYKRYRNSVFANKLTTIPSFLEVFPEEADMVIINAQDVKSINRKLLFEVLLRRTVSAKIDYRLRRNGYFDRKPRYSMISKNSSSPSSSSPSGDKQSDNKDLPKLSKSNSNSSSGEESINTDELLQQNASLYSGVLPSPQISYFTRIEFDGILSDVLNPSKQSQKLVDKLTKSSSSVYSTPKTNRFQNNGKFTTVDYIESPELLYISKLRDSYSHMGALPGKTTTARGQSSTKTPIKKSDINNLIVSKIQPTEKATRNSEDSNVLFQLEPKSNSKSNSKRSSNSSILQNLDDLSSELSSYVNDQNDNEQNTQYLTPSVAKGSSRQFGNKASQDLIQSIEQSNDSIGLKSAQSNLPIRSESPMADIKSMSASISIIGTLSDSGSNSSSANRLSCRDGLREHNLNSIGANISMVALKSMKSSNSSPVI